MRPVLLALFGLLPCLALAQPELTATSDVRVRLFGGTNPGEVRIEAEDAPLQVTLDTGESFTVPHGENVHVEKSGSRLDVNAEDLRLSATRVEVQAEGLARIRTGRANRTYRGRFELELSGRTVRVINEVPLEPYVASVVATEYPFREIEGVRAQAVLARTYVLRHRGEKNGYDVEDDQRSQVYRGAGVVTETTQRGADETRGQVLRHNGRLVDALYSSSSGGHTANNEAVWFTSPVPYLRGVPDPHDRVAPDHRWTTTAPADAVLRVLARRHGGPVDGFHITETSRSGRVVRVRLVGSGKTINGAQLRSAVNSVAGWRTLKSSKFTATRVGDTYRFEGGGFGHGVGMSQYGAHGQAVAGRTYTEILAHYFQGTELDVLPGADAPPALVASSEGSPRRWPTPRRRARTLDSVQEQLLQQAEAQSERRIRPRPRRLERAEAALPAPSQSPDGPQRPSERDRRISW